MARLSSTCWLLAFNLLPALPLDGGRMLRAALWRVRGDFSWATRIAAEAGRATGLLLIGAGFVLFLAGGMFSGAWIAFLGWFVLSAAGSEARHAEARRAISGLRVRDLMVRDPAAALHDDTLAQFMAGVGEHGRFTSYPVLRDGRVVGLLPTSAVLDTPGTTGTRCVWAIACWTSSIAPRLVPEDDLLDALARLSEAGVKRGLVLDGDRLVGYLSVSDVADALTRR